MQTTQVIEDRYVSEKAELSNLSVKDIFFKYIRFLPVFLLCLALTLFGAWVYLRYAIPIYRSSGTLQIKSDKQSGANSDEKLNMLVLNPPTPNIDNEIEVLRSRPLMERVVNALNLQISYKAVGKIKSPDIYKKSPFVLQVFEITDSSKPFTLDVKFISDSTFKINNEKQNFTFGELFRNKYGVFSVARTPYITLGKEYTISWLPTQQVTNALAGTVQVAPKNGTDILTLSIETTSAQKSADVISQLMTEYGEMTKEDKSAEAALTLKFVDTSLRSVQHEIDSIQNQQTLFQKSANLIDLDNQSKDYFDRISEADKNAKDQQIQMSLAEMIENYLKDTVHAYQPVPSSLGLTDLTLNSKVDEYNKAELERTGLLQSHIPQNNPAIRESDRIIEKLRSDMLEAIKNIKASTAVAINSYKERQGVAEGQVKVLPPQIQRLNEFKTQLDSKMGIYTYLMEKKLATTISQASTLSNSKVIEKPLVAPTPVKPNRRSIQLLAILAGLGIPALFIFMAEVVNDKVTTRFDIEKITQAPILGEIGHSYSSSNLVVNKTNRGMVAEQFRIIRSNLQYVLNKIDKQIILVTSSFSGEGKSFVTINLGAVMALAGKKTVVIEFDIRKPKILAGLGLTKKVGVTNYVLGKVDVEDLPVLVPGFDNLYVLSCGPVPPNPSELLLESRVADLFAYLKQNFDVVLIDTAPVGMVSDAMTLGRFAYCSLYIVRQGHTYRKQIGLIDEFYKEGKLPRVSIVINDVKIKPGYGYYGYGRYGYGYGYGYKSKYYEDEEPRHSLFGRFLGMFDLKSRKNGKPKDS